MPAVGERKTKGGVTGEWDGTTWRRVEAPASDTPAGPKPGDRKTKNGITGEWDGSTWRQVDVTGEPETTPDKPTGAGALAAGAGLGVLAGAVPVAQRVASGLANLTTQVVVPDPQLSLFDPKPPVMQTVASPMLKRVSALAGRIAGPANIVKSVYDVASGKESPLEAGAEFVAGEAARKYFRPERLIPKAAQVLQRVATPVANALGAEGVAGMAAPVAVPLAGGLAGVAGTAGFLGALQHDANRTVTTDYSKNTPDTAIARVFSNMRDSEKNRARTLAERQDDPNDVMFTPDDSATVTAGGPPAGGSSVSAAVAAFFGRRGN